MSEIKLLPCPFCGGEKLYISERNYFGTKTATVSCIECHISQTGDKYETKEEAIDAWNTRKPIEDMVEQLDKASDYYECDEQGREHVQMVDLSKAIDIVRGGRE